MYWPDAIRLSLIVFDAVLLAFALIEQLVNGKVVRANGLGVVPTVASGANCTSCLVPEPIGFSLI